MNDKHYRSMDELIEAVEHMTLEEIVNEPWEGPWLISRDELLAAGALDVPPEWRKSLGRKERDLFSDVVGDDHSSAEKHQPSDIKSDDDESADEHQ